MPLDPALFRRARHALGLSAQGMARALRVSDGRLIRRWEKGDVPISGPASVALGYMLRDAGLYDLAREAEAELLRMLRSRAPDRGVER